jgi:chemotaxis protein MotB
MALGTAAGGYGFYEKKQADALRAHSKTCDTQLGECQAARDTERDAKAKALAEGAATLVASRTELEELRAEHAEAEKRLEAFRSLTERFRKMIDSGKLQVILRNGRMVVKLPAGVLFDSGSAELSKEGKDALREVALVLRQVQGRRFMVAGHTDNVPVGTPSTFKNNLDLSTSRALVVAQHLVSSGMSASRLVAAGYGEHEPVQRNTTEQGRHENRRIEIVLLPNVVELPSLADAGPGAGADAGAGSGDAGPPTPKAAGPDAAAR